MVSKKEGRAKILRSLWFYCYFALPLSRHIPINMSSFNFFCTHFNGLFFWHYTYWPLHYANLNLLFVVMLTHISMTSLLTHTVAHSTRPSFKLKTNNQPLKKFLSLAVSWVKVVKNGKILTFRVNFLCQKLSECF